MKIILYQFIKVGNSHCTKEIKISGLKFNPTFHYIAFSINWVSQKSKWLDHIHLKPKKRIKKNQ